MRKREFVGVFIGIFTALICFVFGRNKGFIEGYRDADNMMKNESFKSV